jgi:hypothetical protein
MVLKLGPAVLRMFNPSTGATPYRVPHATALQHYSRLQSKIIEKPFAALNTKAIVLRGRGAVFSSSLDVEQGDDSFINLPASLEMPCSILIESPFIALHVGDVHGGRQGDCCLMTVVGRRASTNTSTPAQIQLTEPPR